MVLDPFYTFERKDEGSPFYTLYIFKDFSTQPDLLLKESIDSKLDEIRQRIFLPKKIIIIINNKGIFSKKDFEQFKSRFIPPICIEIIEYKSIQDEVLKFGMNAIVVDNDVIQKAPAGTKFKKQDGKESEYFIKASLALSEYPCICFIALAVYQKIKDKLPDINQIFVDTSTIIPLVQAVYQIPGATQSNDLPQIINFRSYKGKKELNNDELSRSGAFTLISASTSGALRESKKVGKKKCLTIFYSGRDESELVILKIKIETHKDTAFKHTKLIPVTQEDFSIDYAESEDVLVTKKAIDRLDADCLITRILNLSSGFEFQDINAENVPGTDSKISFDSAKLRHLKSIKKFIKYALDKSLVINWNNFIVVGNDLDEIDIKETYSIEKSSYINIVKEEDFLNDNVEHCWEKENVVVLFLEATGEKLIKISCKLRDKNVSNITYIVGILLGRDFVEFKNLASNITYNTNHNVKFFYDFHCYLRLPLSEIRFLSKDIDVIKNYHLSNGFVFYEKKKSKKLNQILVLFAICTALQMLRNNGQLDDQIFHHKVLSPENFRRFNDPLLQIIFVMASINRELNFGSNAKLSGEMKEVILEIIKQDNSLKENVGKYFVDKLVSGKIKLSDSDFTEIEQYCVENGLDYFDDDSPF